MNANITRLLSSNANTTSKNALGKLKAVMKKYVASPWDAVSKNIMSEKQYNNTLQNFQTKFPANSNGKKFCQTKLPNGNQRGPYQVKLCQSHSGNLFEHSQWSALQIIKWFNEKDPIMEGVDLRTAIVAAFFHDIGKGGDCETTCKETCWHNMYASQKYNGKGDGVHPNYSGDMILGKIPFKLECDKCNTDCELMINDLIAKTFAGVSVQEVALAAYMHWEFGKLNFPGKSLEQKVQIYLDTFNEMCERVGLAPSVKLLRLCMAVACADITAGTNRRLLPNVNGIQPAAEKFLGKDPWVIFGMVGKYLEYRDAVLAAFSPKSTVSGNNNGSSSPMMMSLSNSQNSQLSNYPESP